MIMEYLLLKKFIIREAETINRKNKIIMKPKQIIILLSLIILSITANCTVDTSFRYEYEINVLSDHTQLKLNIIISDTEMAQEMRIDFLDNFILDKPDTTANSLKRQLIKSLQENDHIDLYYPDHYPQYIEEIIDLIESEDNKEEAKKIYRRKFAVNAVQSVGTKTNKSGTNLLVEFDFVIRILYDYKDDIIIPPLSIYYGGKEYKTREMILKF